MNELQIAALRALKLMDLTSLNDDDTDEKIIQLCKNAKTPVGNTAAICVYPRFVPIAKKQLREQGTPQVRVATVTNFPHGNDDVDIAVAETRSSHNVMVPMTLMSPFHIVPLSLVEKILLTR